MNRGMLFAALAATGFAAMATPAMTVCAADDPVELQTVDALNKTFGVHAGFRANHAKGIVAEGSFKPSADAAALSKASLFAGGALPVTARFSDSGGLPDVPDGSGLANPHGLAIKYHLPNGDETDMVTNSLKFFPVANIADFRDMFLAIAASPPDAAHPTKFEQFMASHPSAPAAFGTISTPDSFAHETYYGLDAFVLVSKSGARQAVRYVLVPERAVHLEAADAAKRAPDFLMDELKERLAKGPVTFRLMAQLAEKGDPTNDATKAWPDSRKAVELGIVTLDKAVSNSAEAEKALLFLPGRLVDGIEPSDDPLIESRDSAYAVSFSRRNP